MKALGIHLLIELCACSRPKIDNMAYLERVMSEAARVAGAQVLKTSFKFQPTGRFGSRRDCRVAPHHPYVA